MTNPFPRIITEADLPVMETFSVQNRPVKVACVGDSLTESIYPGILEEILGNDYIIGNFGASGATLLSKGDSPYPLREQYGRSIEFNPDVVIIMLGTNDTKPWNWEYSDQFKRDYCQLTDNYLCLPSKPRVYLCTPPWVASEGNYGITDEPILNMQIPWIREVAAEKELTVIDMHSGTCGHTEFYTDNVHFNDEGYGFIAGLVNYALTRAPLISPVSKLFYDYETVTIAAMPDDEVHYTLDGTEPDQSSPLYTKPIKIVREPSHKDNDVITVSARCYRNGKQTVVNRSMFTVISPLKSVDVDVKPGLTYRYYETTIKTLDDLVLDNPDKTGIVDDITLEPTQIAEFFAFAYDGFIYIPRSDIYTFYLYSDDGSRLWIDDQLIVDNDGLHFRLAQKGCVCLAEGYHKIHIQYFQDEGDASIDMVYVSRDIPLCKYPSDQLFH